LLVLFIAMTSATPLLAGRPPTTQEARGLADRAKDAPFATSGRATFEELKVGDLQLTAATENIHCTGFTFNVVFNVLKAEMAQWDRDRLIKFRNEWYGMTPESARMQLVTAMVNAQVGTYVQNPAEAKVGDFAYFQRLATLDSYPRGLGHSVVITELIPPEGPAVGFKYLSAQPDTQDRNGQELFERNPQDPNQQVTIDKARLFIGRTNP